MLSRLPPPPHTSLEQRAGLRQTARPLWRLPSSVKQLLANPFSNTTVLALLLLLLRAGLPAFLSLTNILLYLSISLSLLANPAAVTHEEEIAS